MRALQGKNIVVTRARAQASEFVMVLRTAGAQVLCCPTIRIVPPPSFRPLDQAIQRLDSYHWLIFTSVNGVETFMKRFKKIFNEAYFPKCLKSCAIGPATAERMRRLGVPVTRISKEYVAESILKEIQKVRGKKILIPRAENAREVLPRALRRRGARVDVVTAYRTVVDKSSFSTFRKWLKNKQVDCITFTSSSTVKNFFSLLSASAKDQLAQNKKIQAASIGPVTSRTLKEFGWPPAIVAAKPTTQHLAAAIVNFYQRNER